MTDLTDNFETLGIADIELACEAKGIKVTSKDTRESLLEKLQPKPKLAKE